MLRRIKILPLVRGIAKRPGQPPRYLRPGTHWLFGRGWDVRIVPPTELLLEKVSDLELDLLASDPTTWDDIVFVLRLAEHERAFVWIDGRLAWAVRYQPRAFWKLAHDVRVQIVDARGPLVPAELAGAALEAECAACLMDAWVVPPGSRGFVLVDEEIRHELPPGRHATWRAAKNVRVEIVPTEPQATKVVLANVFTRDQAEISLELEVTFRVKDAKAWARAGARALASVREVVSSAGLAVVRARTFAKLVADATATALAFELAIAGSVPATAEVLSVKLGRVVVVRRYPRRRFRGLGERGHEVARLLAADDAQPYFRARHETRRH